MENEDLLKETGEDESGLEKESLQFSEIEVPFDPSKIDIQVRTITIDSLLKRLSEGELDLTPDFQRQDNLWNIKQKSRLIESVLLRIPLPSFYFSEDDDGLYSVVDGLQRLCAIFHFMDHKLLNDAVNTKLPEMSLQGLQYLNDLESKIFGKLDRKFQRRISELEITVNVIRASTPSAVKFNVFARLNQGGLPLNPQEIRNAIYPGNWRKELRDLAQNPVFLDITEGKIKPQRQQDTELVLRFLALWNIGYPFERPRNQNLDEFLNESVEHYIRFWDDVDWQNAKIAFERSLHSAKSILDKHAFRKSVGWYDRTPINRGLFEAELIALSALDDHEIEKLQRRKKAFSDLLAKELSPGKTLANNLLSGTGSGDTSNARIREINAIISRVL